MTMMRTDKIITTETMRLATDMVSKWLLFRRGSCKIQYELCWGRVYAPDKRGNCKSVTEID